VGVHLPQNSGKLNQKKLDSGVLAAAEPARKRNGFHYRTVHSAQYSLFLTTTASLTGASTGRSGACVMSASEAVPPPATTHEFVRMNVAVSLTGIAAMRPVVVS